MSDKPNEDLASRPNFRGHPMLGASWSTACSRARRDKRLLGRTYDGLAVQPLYQRAAGAYPWSDAPGLARSSSASNCRTRTPPTPRPCTTSAWRDRLALVFKGHSATTASARRSDARSARCSTWVYLDAITIECDMGPRARTHRCASPRWRTARDTRRSDHAARAVFDPLGAVAAASAASCRGPHRADLCPAGVRPWRRRGFAGRSAPRTGASCSGRRVRGAGACVRARGRARLSARARSKRVALDQARRFLSSALPPRRDPFLTIAKFRALRNCGLASASLRPHPAGLPSSRPKPPGA